MSKTKTGRIHKAGFLASLEKLEDLEASDPHSHMTTAGQSGSLLTSGAKSGLCFATVLTTPYYLTWRQNPDSSLVSIEHLLHSFITRACRFDLKCPSNQTHPSSLKIRSGLTSQRRYYFSFSRLHLTQPEGKYQDTEKKMDHKSLIHASCPRRLPSELPTLCPVCMGF